ncbi:MAG: hypothetical protein HY695_22265 [Deltaproteobacteria bacterium]|nr:hypothetical protein [Deltaproteobacteria bacterium]
MARSERFGRVMHKLDAKPYADRVRKAGKAADRVLRRYGKPRISLAELRNRVDRELGSTSLTELILREREAGW